MNTKKRLIGFALAAVMALCLSPASAFADTAVTVDPLRPYDTNGDGNIDSGDTDYLANHSFALYQIFKGDNDSGKVLTNVTWGSAIVNGSSYDYGTVSSTSTKDSNLILYLANLTVTNSTGGSEKALPGLSESTATAGSVSYSELKVTTAAGLAEYFSSSVVAEDSDKVALVAKGIADFIAARNTAGANIKKEATITSTNETTSVAAGYYLVVDTTDISSSKTNALNKSLLQVVGTDTLHIQVKTAIPTVHKDIWEDKDQGTKTFKTESVGNNTGWTPDSTSTHNLYEQGDYEIGQSIAFRLASTIPDMDDFDTYKYIFRDSMSAGLSLPVGSDDQPDPDNFRVIIQNKSGEVKYILTRGTDYTITFADHDLSDDYDEDFYVTISDLKDVVNDAIASLQSSEPTLTMDQVVANGWQVAVEYNASLNENAIVGNNGNPNTVYLEFSNNPNKSGEGDTDNTGETPEDTVWAFTYGTDVNKYATVDGAQTALSGAEFVLYKYDGTNKVYAKTTTVNKTDSNGYPIYAATDGDTTTYYALINGSYYKITDGVTSETAESATPTGIGSTPVTCNKITSWVAESDCVSTDSNGETTYDSDKITVFTGSTFEFDGLDKHDAYYLKEIKEPTGYNLLTHDIKLEFDSTITEDATTQAQRITSLTLKTYKDNTSTRFAEDITGNVNTGHATLGVENNKGAQMPETGALGTTMMVIVGAGIACAAAVLMITRKKMSAYQE